MKPQCTVNTLLTKCFFVEPCRFIWQIKNNYFVPPSVRTDRRAGGGGGGGSTGSNEPPLQVNINDGGLKTQAANFQLLANSGGLENKL